MTLTIVGLGPGHIKHHLTRRAWRIIEAARKLCAHGREIRVPFLPSVVRSFDQVSRDHPHFAAVYAEIASRVALARQGHVGWTPSPVTCWLPN